MRVELNDVYESFNRLDNPPLSPEELRAPERCVPRRLRGGRRRRRRWSATPRRGRGGDQADVRPPPAALTRRGEGAAGGARGDGAGAGLRTGPPGHRAQAACTGWRSTARPGTWTSRPTTTTRSPAFGVKRPCRERNGVRGRRAGCDRSRGGSDASPRHSRRVRDPGAPCSPRLPQEPVARPTAGAPVRASWCSTTPSSARVGLEVLTREGRPADDGGGDPRGRGGGPGSPRLRRLRRSRPPSPGRSAAPHRTPRRWRGRRG